MRIAGVVVFLMFTTVDERQTILERSDMSKWFVNVEAWRPELTFTNRSAWLSVVVEVVHSHDDVCHCESSELLAPSEVDMSEGANPCVCRANPLFVPELGVLNLLFVPELGVWTGVDSGQDRESPMVVWEECVGLLDRET
ncbi:hypothetical protein V6N13_074024 [Hibiscus sabdariffa]